MQYPGGHSETIVHQRLAYFADYNRILPAANGPYDDQTHIGIPGGSNHGKQEPKCVFPPIRKKRPSSSRYPLMSIHPAYPKMPKGNIFYEEFGAVSIDASHIQRLLTQCITWKDYPTWAAGVLNNQCPVTAGKHCRCLSPCISIFIICKQARGHRQLFASVTGTLVIAEPLRPRSGNIFQ